jgi:hypothetical protein
MEIADNRQISINMQIWKCQDDKIALIASLKYFIHASFECFFPHIFRHEMIL